MPNIYAELRNLTRLQSSIIALIVPFVRYYDTFNRHEMHGGVTFVEIPLKKFGEDICLKSLRHVYHAIAYIFRHPDASHPTQRGSVNRQRVVTALQRLIAVHLAY